jgi:methylphosphotriester-DNA--protein-cysteine methyltransferase
MRQVVDRLLPLAGGALLDFPVGREAADHIFDEVVEIAARLLAAGATVRSVANALDVSERHLRNRFTRRTGLPPKRFARIQRVRTVATGLGCKSLAQLAATAGYYDQAHMTTEFRRLMGVTPAAYAAGHRPRPAACPP